MDISGDKQKGFMEGRRGKAHDKDNQVNKGKLVRAYFKENCLFSDVIEGKFEGNDRAEDERHKLQILDDLREKYWDRKDKTGEKQK